MTKFRPMSRCISRTISFKNYNDYSLQLDGMIAQTDRCLATNKQLKHSVQDTLVIKHFHLCDRDGINNDTMHIIRIIQGGQYQIKTERNCSATS